MELSDTRKYVLFLLICIPARIGIAYLSYLFSDPRHRGIVSHLFAAVLGITALAWLGLFFGIISRGEGFEAAGNRIWWNYLRPVHALLYILYIAHYAAKRENGWIFMAADPVIGLSFSLANKFIVAPNA